MDNTDHIGQRIKSRRLELSMTQEELAKKVGYKSRTSINKIELSRSLPLSKVEKMASALETSPAYLMGWEDEPSDVLIELASKYSEPITIPIEIDNPNIAGINRNLEHIDLYKKALSYIYRLNAEGLDNLINYADLLLHDDKYIEKEK